MVGIGQDLGGQWLLHVDGSDERKDFGPSLIKQLDVALVVFKLFIFVLLDLFDLGFHDAIKNFFGRGQERERFVEHTDYHDLSCFEVNLQLVSSVVPG